MKYQAVIFDLDGVLCFTDEYHFLAWKQLADRLKIPFDRTVNHRLRGVSRENSLEIILEQGDITYSAAEKAAFLAEKNEIYRRLLQNMQPSDVTEETRKVLQTLRARGIRLAIGSSSKNTPFILQRTLLGEYFDAVSDGNNITHSKPHPEVFEKAAAMLCLAPAQCLVVEDAVAGVEAGIAGGFDTAAIGDAARSGKARYCLRALSDLIDLV